MQIAKKQLLGFGCFALVVGMTAFAATLPTGAVSTVGGDVQINVRVYDTNTNTTITKPLDGEVFGTSIIDFSEIHSHAYKVRYSLEKIDEDSTVLQHWDLSDYDIDGQDISSETDFTLDLDNYDGAGIYIFKSVVTAENGLTKESLVRFIYATIDSKQSDVVTTDTAVNFRVSYTSGVKSLTYQVFNSKGEPASDVFVYDTLAPGAGGYADFVLDLTKLGLEAGDYTIRITGYDAKEGSGKAIGTKELSFKKASDTPDTPVTPDTPDAPNVPDTGSILNALNISRSDFIITSLIAFGIISVGALIAIRKSHKK